MLLHYLKLILKTKKILYLSSKIYSSSMEILLSFLILTYLQVCFTSVSFGKAIFSVQDILSVCFKYYVSLAFQKCGYTGCFMERKLDLKKKQKIIIKLVVLTTCTNHPILQICEALRCLGICTSFIYHQFWHCFNALSRKVLEPSTSLCHFCAVSIWCIM